jgi:hypothetical protein
VRAVLELAGYENMLSKIVWSNNKLNNAIATIKWLSSYKHKDFFTSILTKKTTKTDEPVVEVKTNSKSTEKVNKEEKKPAAKKPAVKKTVEAKEEKKPAEKKIEKPIEAKKTAKK